MKNRAKCKKCNTIIEALHETDLQLCICGEIFVEGISYKCGAKDWSNFLRVDDAGNEIVPKIIDGSDEILIKPGRKDIVDMIDNMIKSYETLPQSAMSAPITYYDLMSVLLLLSALARSE